jgi:hypothetical protein
MLTFFFIQHAKEVGWIGDINNPSYYQNSVTNEAKISALYSIETKKEIDTMNYSPMSVISAAPGLPNFNDYGTTAQQSITYI